MIVLTGTSGQLGSAVARQLVERVPANQIVASMRDPAKGEEVAKLGIGLRQGDFADPPSLFDAFAGGDQVYIVSVSKLGEEALRLHRAAIDAAREAGARRILYTSHMGARHGSPFAPADQHASTEADLAKSGVAFTALRHGFYAESCLMMVGDGLKSGELRVPEDGPVAWTVRDDLAEVDAVLLADEGQLEGATPPLTGREAITMAELAVIASEVTGREIRHVTVSDEEWRDARVTAGTPAVYADMLLGTFRAARRGDFASVDPTLEELLGRRPLGMRDVLKKADI